MAHILDFLKTDNLGFGLIQIASRSNYVNSLIQLFTDNLMYSYEYSFSFIHLADIY